MGMLKGMEGQLQNLDTASDQSLILAVRDGDVEKLGMLFERHHGPLFNFFLRMTRSRHLSEDLVQEVFVRILKYRNSYRETHSFNAWMFRIARNVRIDYFKKSPLDEVNIEDKEHINFLPTPDEHTEKSEKIRIMLIALSRLPGEKREVLLLRGVHGLKFEEIAEVMKCSLNTIKSRAFRAIRDLRVEIQRLESVGE
jgi:RNA polymerase sigma factor (sigma-70 family)